MMTRKNIVLLTIECLRKAEFGVPGNVPNLDSIAKKSLVFENFYQCSSWTAPSIYSIFTSKYLLMNKGRIGITKYDLTLAEILQKNGYYTAGLTSVAWLSRYFGFNEGFINFHDSFTSSSHLKKIAGKLMRNRRMRAILQYLMVYKNHYWPGRRTSDELNAKALDWLNKNSGKKPFFLWIHYPESHEPYYPSRQATNYRFSAIWRLNKKAMKNMPTRKKGELKLSHREKKMLLDLYKSEIIYVDKKVGELLEKLEVNGYLNEDTYVFIMGDHGQQFFEHGDFGHGIHLYQELVNVPLLIYNKNFKGKKDKKLISGIDIAPTVLQLLGIVSPFSFLGRSIFSSINSDRDIILEEERDKRKDFIIEGTNVYLDLRKYKIGLVKYPYKFIRNPNCQDELYDLEKDPEEKENLINVEIMRANNLGKQLDQHLRRIHETDLKQRIKGRIKNLKTTYAEKAKDIQERQKETEKEIKRRLRSLGYLE